MAHSVKNPHIKHAIIHATDYKQREDGRFAERYLCIQVVDITDSKVAHRKKDVTCKNCLQIIGTKEICVMCGEITDNIIIIPDKPNSKDEMMKIWRRTVNAGDAVCAECFFK